MELESLFTGSKWDIMKELRKSPKTPLELSRILESSSPNISQQLRLLELAELIKKERSKGTEKGRPETKYSLTRKFSYIISINNLTEKKILDMGEHHSAILNIWFLQNTELHYYLEKFFWLHEDIFKSSEFIGFLGSKENEIELLIINKNPDELITVFDNLTIIREEKSKKLKALFFTPDEAGRFSVQDEHFISLINRVHPIHDPNDLLNKLKMNNPGI